MTSSRFEQYKRSRPVQNNDEESSIQNIPSNQQSASQQSPSKFEKYKRSATNEDEGIFTLRNLGRTAKSVASTIFGAPGDLINFISPLAQKSAEFITGKPFPEKGIKPELPTSSEIKKNIETSYPNLKPTTPGEKSYEEAIELFTSLGLPLPGQKLKLATNIVRPAIGTALGLGAKETARSLGATEDQQEAIKSVTAIIPQILKGKLSPSNKEMKELYDAGRKLGYNDKQLAPLLQSDTRKKLLQKIAKPTKYVGKNIAESKEKFGELFSEIRERAKALPEVSQKSSKKIQNSFYDLLEDLEASKLPPSDKIEAIQKVEKAIQDLERGKFKPHEAIDTYRDINKSLRNSGAGQKPLASLKGNLVEILKKSDPKLAQDFQIQNKLYQKFKQYENSFTPSLKKQITEGIISGSEAISLLTGIATGNFSLISSVVGTETARRIATKLLTDPSWQNIHRNSVKSLINQSPKSILLIEKQINEKLKKSNQK